MLLRVDDIVSGVSKKDKALAAPSGPAPEDEVSSLSRFHSFIPPLLLVLIVSISERLSSPIST